MENCNGCLIKCVHYKAVYEEALVSKIVLIECPCGICLIKMVCTDGCVPYNEYITKTIHELEDLEQHLIICHLESL